MSVAASEALESAAVAAPAAPAPGEAERGDGVDLCESEDDTRETRMTYDPNAHVPMVVIVVWVTSMIALGIYLYLYYFGDLARWGRP